MRDAAGHYTRARTAWLCGLAHFGAAAGTLYGRTSGREGLQPALAIATAQRWRVGGRPGLPPAVVAGGGDSGFMSGTEFDSGPIVGPDWPRWARAGRGATADSSLDMARRDVGCGDRRP